MALLAAVAALAAAPVHALAPPDGKGGGGDSNIAPKFAVTVADDPATTTANLWAPGPGCPGETPDSKSKDIVTVVFFGHQTCATLTTSDGSTLTDDLTIRTHRDANGDIDSIEIEGQDVIGSEGVVLLSEAIPIDPPVTPARDGFEIHVHGANVTMYRCDTHRMMKRTSCADPAGTFSIDDISYVLQDSTSASIESTIRYAPN